MSRSASARRTYYRRPDIERVIRCIQNNPIKAGRPEQAWPFVTPYNGWLARPAKG